MTGKGHQNLSFCLFLCPRKTKRAHLSSRNKRAQTVGYINFCFMWASPRGIMASVPFVQAPTAKKFHFPSVAEILKIHNIILPQTPQNVKCFLPILAPKINQYFFFFSLSREHLSQRGAKALFSRLFSVSARQKMHSRT